MINETGVYFFPGGGHDHDGESASLIDTNSYSIFDFPWTTEIGGPDRKRRLENNYNSFKNFIITTVNDSIIRPAGIFFQPGSINASSDIITNSITTNLIQAGAITADLIQANTITANNIQTGTITGNLLNANVVLVNQAILSNNYVPGVSGWAIDGDGTAEFSNAIIRGTVEAASGLIGDLEINNGQLRYTDNINDTGLMLGPRSFPVNDGSPALVISSSFASGSFTSVRATEISMTGNITCNAVDSEFLSVTNTISGDINGNASTADLATTALNADRLDNFLASGSDVASTVVVRGNDASVRGQYLVMTTGDTGGTTELRIRNDGYIFRFASRRELKNTIENIDSNFALSIINSLQPVSFRMNQPQYIGDLFSEREATYREYGFIAQDVAEVDANLATYGLNAEGDEVQPQAWSSHTMISLSVAAIQGLVSEVNELKSRVAQLEQRG